MTDNSAETARELSRPSQEDDEFGYFDIGQSFMEQYEQAVKDGALPGFICAQSPVEVLWHLINERDEARTEAAATVSRDREAIARIIDPEAFGENFGRFDPQMRENRRASAMRKADAVLLLNPVGADGPWCQPMDQGKHTPRRFIVMFEDADRGYSLFDNEAEAREFFNRANTAWNCWLFGALPLNEATPVSDAGAEAMREALKNIRARTYSSDRMCVLSAESVAEISDIAAEALEPRP